MRRPLFILAALAFLCACAKREATKPTTDESAALQEIADDYLQSLVRISPFQIVYAGVGDVIKEDFAAMDENSPVAIGRFRAEEDELMARLAQLDRASLQSRADAVVYDVMKESLAASRQARICEQQLWSLNHMSGWQSAFAQVADAQPVSTPVERAMALARWRQLPDYVRQEEENLRAGLAAGYSAPKRVVARVIAQLDAIAGADPMKSPFMSFASRAPEDPVFAEAAKKLGAEEIAPAIVRFRDFLKSEYEPKARHSLAIKSIPNGAACYEAMLRGYHTAEIGAKATYERGLKTVKENRGAVIARGEAIFGETDFSAILARVSTAPGNRFSSEAELIDWTRANEPVAKGKIAPLFKSLPAQALAVEPYDAYLKGTGQSSRYEPKPVAEGPAIYRINTDDWASQTRGEAEIVLYHEAWPGHHLQIATAYSVEGLHPITRLLGSTAFIEGWARYAERLAEEAGLYETGYGAITRRAWPARGMAVDPGLHLYGWTNEQAGAFLIESGRFDAQSVEVMLDRIAVMPGQLTAYDTGGLEIAALRAEAARRLGAKFDVRAFHACVLENGALPLSALRANVEAWIAAQESKKSSG